LSYDDTSKVASISFSPIGRPCFNLDLLQELDSAQQILKTTDIEPSHLLVMSSSKGVFSFGGDLGLFTRLIRTKDLQGLTRYMKLCIDVLMSTSYQQKMEKVAVVQGIAFGGGFEAALSCSTIIAEKSAVFGFPERLFNLFPGMGAYSFLIQRVSPSIAKRMITCERKKYTAEELYDLGIVDMVVEDGAGKDAAYDYIDNQHRFSNAYNAIREVTDYYHKVDYNGLYKIGENWVKAALKLSDRDLRKMEIIGKGQDKYAA
jgi:DSF synthase